MDEKLAIRAYRISKKQEPRDNKAVAAQLGLSSAREAAALINVGRRLQEIQDAALTESETLVLRILLALEREALREGETASQKSKYISWEAGKGAGWAGGICKKRLVPYGFITHSRNGHIWLTPAGMAVAQCFTNIITSDALAAGAAGKQALQ